MIIQKQPILISTVEARNRFSELINRAAFGSEKIVLTRRGRGIAVISPLEHLEVDAEPASPVRTESRAVNARSPRGATARRGRSAEPRAISAGTSTLIAPALWDLTLTPREFLGIIGGDISRPWPSRGWCVARLLESVGWFDVVKIVKPSTLCAVWPEARPFVRASSLREGMDYACTVLS